MSEEVVGRSRSHTTVRNSALRVPQGVVVLVLATAWPATSHAYRTANDIDALSGPEIVRWGDAPIQLAVSTDPPAGMSVATFHSLVVQATNVWSEPSCSAADFTFGAAPSASVMSDDDGVNGVYWVHDGWVARGLPPDAHASTDLRYSATPSGGWQVAEADVYLNAESFSWLATTGAVDGDTRSVLAVLVHEFGHVLGILHPCELDGQDAPSCSAVVGAEATTMYPAYTGPTQAAISADDQAAVCYLYPSEPCICPVGEFCGESGCVSCDDFPCACESCGELPDGSECTDSLQCLSRSCVEGECTTACIAGRCPPGFACVADACLSTQGAFGDNCDEGINCQSALCLVTHAHGNLCTRVCHLNAPCPANYRCDSVDGTQVCNPMVSDGCSVASRTSGTTSFPLQMMALIAAMSMVALRRSRP